MPVMEDILRASLTASDDQKAAALRVLLGTARVEEPGDHKAKVEPFMTLREVGRLLGVSPCSLWRWGVPGHELGGRRKFRLSEVREYLESEAFKERAAELRGRRPAPSEGRE